MRQTAFALLTRSVLGVALEMFCALAPCQAQVRGENSEPNKPQSTARGRRMFESHCAGCHGLDGRGGERAPNIVTNSRLKGVSDQTLLQIIRDGIPRRGMPAFNLTLARGQIQEVVAFIRGKSGKQSLSRVSGNPKRGQALFFGKAGCGDCHMISGKGGFLGRELSDYGRDHSPVAILDATVNPNINLSPERQVVVVTTRDGQRLSGVTRNEDNFSLQLLDTNGNFHLLMKSDLADMKREPRSPMPGDYDKRLSARELEDLVSYLASAGR